jgi:catechol 2,3-dioxygenase-like lactoylglutathione lyase family enzyme
VPSSLDHISINVSNLEAALAFYTKALAPLGVSKVMGYGPSAGFGRGGKPDFWIHQGVASYQAAAQTQTITPVHICFSANSRDDVDAFYQAALDAGARDFGKPGLRPEYHANYYGAFVLDPDGHNVEACIHTPA